MTDRLKEIEERAKKAPPGALQFVNWEGQPDEYSLQTKTDPPWQIADGMELADVVFFAHARADVEWLAAEVRRTQARLKTFEAMWNGLRKKLHEVRGDLEHAEERGRRKALRGVACGLYALSGHEEERSEYLCQRGYYRLADSADAYAAQASKLARTAAEEAAR